MNEDGTIIVLTIVGFHNFQVPGYDAISWKIWPMGCQVALMSYLIWHAIGWIFQAIVSYPGTWKLCNMTQSQVSPNLGFRLLHNTLKNVTNGMPDKIWCPSYLASHWSYFSQYCAIHRCCHRGGGAKRAACPPNLQWGTLWDRYRSEEISGSEKMGVG